MFCIAVPYHPLAAVVGSAADLDALALGWEVGPCSLAVAMFPNSAVSVFFGSHLIDPFGD